MTDLQAPQPAPGSREAFEDALKTKPEARFWNTTDAMLWAFQAGAAGARFPSPEGAEWIRATTFIQHVQNVAGSAGAQGHWADEFLDWYKPDEWFGEHRAAAVFIGTKIAALAAQPQQAENPNNCGACDHKRSPDGGWCYMFRDEPAEVCAQHTASRKSDVKAAVAIAMSYATGEVPSWATDTVPMPENADQAAAMALVGERRLRDNAPERLKATQAPAPAPEPVERIMKSAQTLALAMHFKQPKEAQDRARENLRAVAQDAIAAAQAPAVAHGKTVAWGLFAKVEDGSWHLQHPVRFTEEDAKADRAMYERTTMLDIRPLYDLSDVPVQHQGGE